MGPVPHCMSTAVQEKGYAGAPVTAIVNASARQAGAERAEWLANLLRERYDMVAEVALAQNGTEIESYARLAGRSATDLIIAAGGDGTINAVAAQLVGSAKRLGVLPLGTLNHFAKDLGIPTELEAAVQVAIEGRAAAVDVASVNGHYFLNNSSLGLYPRMVAAREQEQEKGHNKWLAWLPALWQTLRRYPVLAVRMSADDRQLLRRTPIVFVGNNQYELEGWGLGSRACLDAGRLHVSVMRHNGRAALARMFLYALFGKLGAVEEFDSLCTRELWIDSRRTRLTASLDGEVVALKTPLHYQVHARALTVMVPS